MFGCLSVSNEYLTEEMLLRYKACYCGLCRSLRSRHGELTGFCLSYDMTFLVLLLSALYEPEETKGEDICLVHPRAAQPWINNEFVDYAADMNVILSYLKCMDDWRDDGNLISVTAAAALRREYKALSKVYPEFFALAEESVSEISALEKSNEDNPDAVAAPFGRLMGEMFAFKKDRWSPSLRAIGENLGRFIYLSDACVDLNADVFRNRYNPFRQRYGLDNEELFRNILKLYLADCVYIFDTLPIVDDADLIKNILCVGVWNQFNKKYGQKKE